MAAPEVEASEGEVGLSPSREKWLREMTAVLRR